MTSKSPTGRWEMGWLDRDRGGGGGGRERERERGREGEGERERERDGEWSGSLLLITGVHSPQSSRLLWDDTQR